MRAKKEMHPSCEPSPGLLGRLRKDPVGAVPSTPIKPGPRREEGTEEPVFPSGKTSVAFVGESWDFL